MEGTGCEKCWKFNKRRGGPVWVYMGVAGMYRRMGHWF